MSQQINLANPQLLRKRYAFGVREMAIAGGIMLAVALAWGGVAQHRAGTLEAEASASEARLAEAQRAFDARQTAASRPASALLAQRVEAAQAQVAQREALLASIGWLTDGSSAGFAPRLRALSHSHTDGVWLNGFVMTADALALRGSALHAGLLGTYLDRLGRQPPFVGLRFSGVQATPAQAGPAGEAVDAVKPPPAQIDFELLANASASKEATRDE